MMQSKVLVVDDERGIRESLAMILEDDGYIVVSARDGEEALQKIKELKIDLVILDVWLPKIKGTELLKELLAIKENLPVIMISGHGDIETAGESLKNGAIDFIEKPLIKAKILVTVRNALNLRILEKENNRLQQENENFLQMLNKVYDLKGDSQGIEELRRKISRAAGTDFNVLIQGGEETQGELIAHMIHLQSNKRGKPFVGVNCAVISPDELCGCPSRPGKLEEANQGTLFLNNIDQLDLPAQAMIFKTLADNEFSVTDNATKINPGIRVIAASLENLEERVRTKTFRQDLYYRLKEITIKL
ncbi:MAG: sigma 54-interacting transcriptional regulator [bacterium]|nr:sigma 54-interacting transcriptional regulator [bacterium]